MPPVFISCISFLLPGLLPSTLLRVSVCVSAKQLQQQHCNVGITPTGIIYYAALHCATLARISRRLTEKANKALRSGKRKIIANHRTPVVIFQLPCPYNGHE